MATNYVIAPVKSVKIGAEGAAENACTDLGSVKEVVFSKESSVEYATSSKYHGAKMEGVEFDPEAKLTIEGEEITLANIALALGATVDGTELVSDGGGGPITPKTVYIRGWVMNGAKKILHVRRLVVMPGSELKLGRDQQTYKLECDCLVDQDSVDGYKLFKFADDDSDVVAPTVSSVDPADAATAVAVGSNITVVFSEAMRSSDVNARTIIVHSDAGAVVAGTITLSADGTQAVFNPTSNLSAATKYHVLVVAGIRDVAGNALAATSSTEFTTA